MGSELGDRGILVGPNKDPCADPGILGLPVTRPAGAILLFDRASCRGNAAYNVDTFGTYVLALVALLGVCFTWWARIHLSRFWSNAITHKEDHRIIDTGPYGMVRQPIYTG